MISPAQMNLIPTIEKNDTSPRSIPQVRLSCPDCSKSSRYCVCAEIRPLPNRTHVLILQHPQEPDKNLGTASLTHLSLKESTLKVGLSWPNLTAALGGRAVQPSRWAVLYLGSGPKGKVFDRPLQFVSKKGESVSRPAGLDGIVVLDGTWSQAKALWWRNSWLLKLKRAVLIPSTPSLYGKLRKEPRKECVSTLETVAETLTALGESPIIEQELKRVFKALLQQASTQNRNKTDE